MKMHVKHRLGMHVWAMFFLAAALGVESESKDPILLETLTTKSGKVFKNCKVTEKGEEMFKVVHDAGVASVKYSDAPQAVLEILQIQTVQSDEEIPKLNNPFKAGPKVFENAEIVGVDPDGIKISYRDGVAKVKYEFLEESLKEALGGFDSAAAIAFREMEAEQNRAAYRLAREAIAAGQNVGNSSNSESGSGGVDEKDRLMNDPQALTMSANVALEAQSVGGKTRGTNWATAYGSYDRIEVSQRRASALVRSVTERPQRVRVQCLEVSREVSGAKDVNLKVVFDENVELGGRGEKAVTASIFVGQRDENYAALGVRVREGAKYLGWVWRAIDGHGRICAIRSSTPGYDRYGWQTPVKSR
jgi:hypothetical protein